MSPVVVGRGVRFVATVEKMLRAWHGPFRAEITWAGTGHKLDVEVTGVASGEIDGVVVHWIVIYRAGWNGPVRLPVSAIEGIASYPEGVASTP